MPFWAIGLAKRSSAERACKWGGIACFFQVARQTFGNIASVSLADKPLDNAIAWFIGASLIPLFLLAAGMRLWRHRGWVWGSVAAIMMALDLLIIIATPTTQIINAYIPITTMLTANPSVAAQTAAAAWIAIMVVNLALVINGARVALALRTVEYSSNLRGAFP